MAQKYMESIAEPANGSQMDRNRSFTLPSYHRVPRVSLVKHGLQGQRLAIGKLSARLTPSANVEHLQFRQPTVP
jgi:hypothetical protein